MTVGSPFEEKPLVLGLIEIFSRSWRESVFGGAKNKALTHSYNWEVGFLVLDDKRCYVSPRVSKTSTTLEFSVPRKERWQVRGLANPGLGRKPISHDSNCPGPYILPVSEVQVDCQLLRRRKTRLFGLDCAFFERDGRRTAAQQNERDGERCADKKTKTFEHEILPLHCVLGGGTEEGHPPKNHNGRRRPSVFPPGRCQNAAPVGCLFSIMGGGVVPVSPISTEVKVDARARLLRREDHTCLARAKRCFHCRSSLRVLWRI